MYLEGQIRRPHFDATQEPELRLYKKQFWQDYGHFIFRRGSWLGQNAFVT